MRKFPVFSVSNMLFLLLSTLFLTSNAKIGYDINDEYSEATMKCLKEDGISFIIPRIYRSNGKIDEPGITTVKHAREAGITEVDGYIFPCLASHCASAATQVSETLNAVKKAETSIRTLWLDIERYEWPSSHESNRKFIEEMVAEAKKFDQDVGIYSNYYNWEAIVGLDYHGQSSLKLWWAEYDGSEDFSHYKEFGGWSKPHIHQYKGTSRGKCDVSADLNWMP